MLQYKQIFGGKNRQYWPMYLRSSYGLEYRKADKCINSKMNCLTSCRNLVRFGAVTRDFTRIDCLL